MICSACGTDQDEVDSGYCINPSCGARLDQAEVPGSIDEPEQSGKSGKPEPARLDDQGGLESVGLADQRASEPAERSGQDAHPWDADPTQPQEQQRPTALVEEPEERAPLNRAEDSGWGTEEDSGWGAESAWGEESEQLDHLDRLDRLEPLDRLDRQPAGEPGQADQPEDGVPVLPGGPAGRDTTAPLPDQDDTADVVAAYGSSAPLPYAPRASGAHRAEAEPPSPRRRTAVIAVCGTLVLSLAAVIAISQVVSKPDADQLAGSDQIIQPVSGSDGTTASADSDPSPSGSASATPTSPSTGESTSGRPSAAGSTSSRPNNAVRFVVNGNTKREANCPQGVTWSTDRTHGPAASFDHKGRNCLTSGPMVDTTADFTVSAWVKLSARPSDLSMTAVSQDGNKQSGFYLQYSGVHRSWAFNRMSADVMNPDGNTTATSSAPVTLEWTHLTGTFHAGTGTIQVYVNGAPGTATTQHARWRATGPLVIGRAMWNGERGNFVHGQVADVRVWSRTLTAQEVSGLPWTPPAG
ncbi:hypothetical protein GCM10027280_24650 [Micromonospora polyrhachis]|uniref:LamG-like jellyroll fold domain-containing protein n=1 Tax=Micromonospora polyrhachis TaxID=1282883 RepID=A0A7W7STA4_9ACTN|nr:LamG-like jellyroll fold domain-containing protein [Micromonospora polyrhachis]MBB4960441.1 hypothetical protein [Micromonospora polyrhachis]